jgi:hypothetical protein
VSDLQGRGTSIRRVILYTLTLLHGWIVANFIYFLGDGGGSEIVTLFGKKI